MGLVVMPAFCRMLERDRHGRGFTEGQVVLCLGIGVREYRRLVAGEKWPDPDTWDRTCELYGWPQSFVSTQ
jgi:hypothetical protein